MLPLVVLSLLVSATHEPAGARQSSETKNFCRSAGEKLDCFANKARNDVYPQLLVFVSFSMPLATFKALGTQVNAVGGALVFRGLVEGSFKKTALKLKELGEPALIDPTLFTAYKIESVPTFVLRKNTTDQAKTGILHDRMSGNISLLYALEQFEKQGDVTDVARTLVSRLLQKFRKSS